jgi:predicted acetyltransferase
LSRELRPVTEAEAPAYVAQLARIFNGRTAPPEQLEQRRSVLDLERALGVFEDGQLVATAGGVGFELTVPGRATVPAAGITHITVLATHRRQGLLTRMMRRQLDDARQRGEQVAILYPTEGAIYGRFGFGVATYEARLAVERADSAFHGGADVSGLRYAEPLSVAELLPRIEARALAGQPGAVLRSAARWRLRLSDPDWMRRTPGDLQVVVRAEHDGFAAYRVDVALSGRGRPASVLYVAELAAATPEAYAALWRHCLDVDLVTTVEAPSRSPDEPLRHLLRSPRALAGAVSDSLWLRLVDVEAALNAREYGAGGGRVVLEVEDAFCPWNDGRYAVTADGCRRGGGEPDLVLPADALGACYLGGNRFATLVAAGRVTERTPGAAAAADVLFASPVTPWCPYHF